MFFTIYKITNHVNNKIYIGAHKTNNLNDSYMGSGKLIKRALKKYGISNFSKEILHIFDNKTDMYNKEEELVLVSEDTYNLLPGGNGGFDYINDLRKCGILPNPMHSKEAVVKRQETINSKYNNFYKQISKEGNSKLHELLKDDSWKAEWKSKHEKSLPENHQKGKNNSQFGKKFKFVNDGIVNKKIPLEELGNYLSSGYILGRK